MLMLCFLSIFIEYILKINAMPLNLTQHPQIPPIEVLDFMKKFGYLEEDDVSSEATYTNEGIAEALKNVQKYGALPQSGILDNATLKLMTKPRCGVRDIIKPRLRRYTFGSLGWNKREITYFISNWSPLLTEKIVAENIQLALDTWGEYGSLTFKRHPTPNADIFVKFGKKEHGDNFPFDGPGNVLGHAFYPNEGPGLGGDIHFDNDENWIVKSTNEDYDEDGVDFQAVALHELGHSLGLGHSTDPNAVMFAYYKIQDNTLQLSYDDIMGMYELYIRRPVGVQPNKFSTTQKPYTTIRGRKSKNKPKKPHINLPDICNGSYDAITSLKEELYIFKKQYVWRLSGYAKILPNYPITIHQMFPTLPKKINKIDAAYEREDGNLILFTRNEFWVHDGIDFIENSPKKLTVYGLPWDLERIDAAQIWGRNGKLYLYSRDIFWRFNPKTGTIDEGYPKSMKLWEGLPANIDAALTWTDGFTYFFKDDLYWKFDNNFVKIDDNSPLPAPEVWLGCEEDSNKLLNWLENN